jgi:SAM-dependent methyltransferase
MTELQPARHLGPPSRAALDDVCRLKYGDPPPGWSPRMRRRFGYFSPDDRYEAVVAGAVHGDTLWLDVGCGRFLFPSNEKLARALADRCRLLVGVDPDATIHENPYVHERVQASLAEYRTEHRFDLVTLRMVAEHVTDPEETVASIAALLRPGGRAVIYTVFKWSPGALFAKWVPFRAHHFVKRVLWRVEEKDTFPVANLMNTRGALRRLFAAAGCREAMFHYLDDCRTLGRFRTGHFLELCLWRLLRAFRLHYPELCILGVYER